ncbi:MAG: T9SS type A sorting domain-containing protein [Bacteroidetes bacterium]|nr:T9SS type A sorting domain-containing protein [Bacteroidota bacterium]
MKKSIYSISLFLAGLFLIGQQALAQNPDPEVTIIQPNVSNIEWVIGETYLISWTDNFINTVDLWLVDYTDSNDVTEQLIDDGVEGSTYEWFIDPADFSEGSKYKVRVQSSVNSSFDDESYRYFSLVTSASNAFINIQQPNVSNINWVRGNEYLISWTDNIEDPLDIYLVIADTYSADPEDETHWIEIETAVEGSTFTWDIWDTLTLRSDYKVLITDENREVKDLSYRNFSIVESGGTITMIQPNVSNIQWIYGNEYLISWNATTTGTFDLYLIKDYNDWNSNSPFDMNKLIEIDTDVEGTTYSWDIEDNELEALLPGSRFRVMVRAHGTDIYKISYRNFSIVEYSGFIQIEQPNVSNITWVLGSEHLISWLDNIDSDMNIYLVNDEEYDEDDSDTWDLIEAGVPGTTYTWDIDPNLEPRDDYRILITTPDYSIKDVSYRTFTLVEYDGEITIIQPNVSGIEWVIGNEYLISWTDNVDAPVDIELISEDPIILASDNASNSQYDNGLDNGDNGGDGFEEWGIGISGNGITLVDDPANGNISGMDNPSFGIVAPGNPANPNDEVIVVREFSDLEVGSTLSFDWGIYGNNGHKAFHIRSNDGTIAELVFFIETGNNTIFRTHQGLTEPVFNNLGNNVMHFTFEYLESGEFEVKANARDAGEADYEEIFAISSPVDAISFHAKGQLDDGNNLIRANWFNNLQIHTYLADIATDVEGSTYVWNTAGYPAGSHKVRIFKGDIEDISYRTFDLVLSGGGDLDFNQPSAGDVWYKGVTYWIIWEDDIMEPLDIYLKNVAGTVNIPIDTDFEGSMIDYLVPTNNTVPTGVDYYIQIVSSLDPNMEFNSDEFTITEEVLAAIFPNPASQYFNVQFDEQLDGIFDVTIFDRFNNRVLETRLNAATKQHRISTANMPEGFYFVQMVNGDKTITKKIVVKH